MVGRKGGGEERAGDRSDENRLLENVLFGYIVGYVIEDGIKRAL